MQGIGSTITRARRNNIGDAVRRSSARNPQKDAIVFGGRRWSYAGLDAGVNRVANALLTRGLDKRRQGGRLRHELGLLRLALARVLEGGFDPRPRELPPRR